MGLLDKAAEKKAEPKVVEVEKPKRQRRERKTNTEIDPVVVTTETKKPKRSRKKREPSQPKLIPEEFTILQTALNFIKSN